MKNTQAGFTLIELLVTVIVAAMIFLALSGPFMMERRFWSNGYKKAVVQRDAGMILHAMEIKIREMKGFAIDDDADSDSINFNGACSIKFQGGPNYNGRLEQIDCADNKIVLIDGVLNQVKEFNASEIVANKLIDLKIRVAAESNNNIDEILQTRVYLRNG